MRRIGAVLCVAAASAAGVAGCGGSDSGDSGSGGAKQATGTVVMLLPNTTTVRFVQHDAPAFQQSMKELAPDVKVKVLNAGGDANKQLQQAETAITQNAKAVVLAAADPNIAAGILAKAQQAQVPVISYEHEAVNGHVTYQVMFDPFKVGVEQGKYAASKLDSGGAKTVMRLYGNKGDNYTTQDKKGQDQELKTAISEGQLEVACEAYTPGWDPAEAQQLVEQCLTKTHNRLDAVIAMNDGTAQGAIAALQGDKLEGQIPVYGGQDANLDALKYILAGWQESTVLKDYPVEGKAAAELTVAALKGTKPKAGLINGTFDNGAEKVPTAYLSVQSVDAKTMDRVIKAGLYTWKDLCTGIAKSSATCKKEAAAS
jgi:ABC-type xylose transport system substrate-binding protein